MLPEVEKYITAYRAAQEAYNKAHSELAGHHSWAACGPLVTARDAATAEAWNTLLKEATDPLVRWVRERCWNYRDEATDFLAILPATLKEMDELADQKLWCERWYGFPDEPEYGFRHQLIEAGLVKDESGGDAG